MLNCDLQLKRQHSADLLSTTTGKADATGTSSSQSPTGSTPTATGQGTSTPPPGSIKNEASLDGLDQAFLGSPLKKPRASVSGPDDGDLRRRMSTRFSSGLQEVVGPAPTASNNNSMNDNISNDEEKPASSQVDGMEEEL